MSAGDPPARFALATDGSLAQDGTSGLVVMLPNDKNWLSRGDVIPRSPILFLRGAVEVLLNNLLPAGETISSAHQKIMADLRVGQRREEENENCIERPHDRAGAMICHTRFAPTQPIASLTYPVRPPAGVCLLMAIAVAALSGRWMEAQPAKANPLTCSSRCWALIPTPLPLPNSASSFPPG